MGEIAKSVVACGGDGVVVLIEENANVAAMISEGEVEGVIKFDGEGRLFAKDGAEFCELVFSGAYFDIELIEVVGCPFRVLLA